MRPAPVRFPRAESSGVFRVPSGPTGFVSRVTGFPARSSGPADDPGRRAFRVHEPRAGPRPGPGRGTHAGAEARTGAWGYPGRGFERSLIGADPGGLAGRWAGAAGRPGTCPVRHGARSSCPLRPDTGHRRAGRRHSAPAVSAGRARRLCSPVVSCRRSAGWARACTEDALNMCRACLSSLFVRRCPSAVVVTSGVTGACSCSAVPVRPAVHGLWPDPGTQ